MTTAEGIALEPFAGPAALPGVDPEVAAGLLAAASGLIRAYCGWHIAPSITETITVDGSGTTVLGLPTLHLTDLSEVTINGEDEADVEWTERGLLRLSCRGPWPQRWRSITVTMTHGYDCAPAAMAAVATAMARRVTVNPDALTNESIGQQYTAGYAANPAGFTGLAFVPAEAAWLLGPYRIPLRP